jgi:hypothetical protein
MNETGRELNELAMLYLLADRRGACLIQGPRNVAELEANLTVAELPPMSPDVVERLRTIGNTKILLTHVTDDGAHYEPVALGTALAAALRL